MEENKSLFSVYKTEEERIQTILHNVLVMLGNRIYLVREEGVQVKIPLLDPKTAKVEDKGDNVYLIHVASKEIYVLKILFQKITAIGKQSIISDFFKDYPNQKKIVVAIDFKVKIQDYTFRNNTQLFREISFLQDILTHAYQSEYELLSSDEMKKVKEEYNFDEYTGKKLTRGDAIAMYYNLKVGDVIRIIRNSPTSGKGLDYKIVTK